MSNVSRGLFDPRRRMQHWPEPNDDPNIPYAWGEGGLGYAISGYRPNDGENIVPALPPETVLELVNNSPQVVPALPPETVQDLVDNSPQVVPTLPAQTVQELVKNSPQVVVKPVETKAQPKEPTNETVVSVAVASSMVLGVWGLLDGYSQSQNTGGERIFDSLEKAVIYATGIGFIVSKLRKG